MGRLLAPALDRAQRARLAVQLADSIREQIRRHTLDDGDRLPSTRALADELQVARGVVQQTYEQLIAEGWLRTERGTGTFVNAPTALPTAPTRQPSSAPVKRPKQISLRPGEPWGPERSDARWRRAWREVAHQPPPTGYPDPQGDRRLRALLAEHLAQSRGLTCDPDQIIVTSGTTHGLTLALDALRDTDRSLVVENPGYPSARHAAGLHGWDLRPVPVDAAGLEVAALPSTSTAAYLTPAHQYPTGAHLTADRRTTLTSWALAQGVLLIEDDYDSEFRYDIAALPPLAALAPDSTLYLGTVSKTLGAGVRFGWAVAPADLVAPMLEVRRARHDYPAWTTSCAMTSLLRDGAWQHATRRARRLYADRDAYVEAELASYGRLLGAGAGLHTVLVLPRHVERAVVEGCAAHEVDVAALSEYHAEGGAPYGLVIGYGNITDDDLVTGIRVLRAVLDAAL